MADPSDPKISPRGEAILEAMADLENPFALPIGPERAGQHSWFLLNGNTFDVRGPNYLKDKKKVPSAASLFDLMHVDLLCSNDRMGHIVARQDSWLRKARAAGDKRFYLVVVWVTPALPYVHVTMYLAVNQDQLDENIPVKTLWQRFVDESEEGDKFRNDRWKVIPRIAEGAWIVQKAVGTKPAMLAQKLTHYWILCDAKGKGGAGTVLPGGGAGGAGTADPEDRVPVKRVGTSYIVPDVDGLGPYIESDCDVASSSVAAVLVSMVQSYAKSIVIDIGLAIEPRDAPELPEACIGAIRFNRIDVTKPPFYDATDADWVLGAPMFVSSSQAAAK